ncbi:helix-turn-helix domain-containing protein [Streptomyces sp. ISL-11]|uniref:helix-turn-helix domain-containing protein n=1 Tax=Streptomyces sp. ISL-11 TaxID=2819174 RepID=UPI001BE69E5E|nr:helix-turn-helix domain-containing protein [Streptomyces sp. ISL-11]MBT2383725.1 helix-turn-helix domain-containing protein [Streptomyces sp. ISL-11]
MTEASAFAVLELLADEAPIDQFESLVEEARWRGTTGAELAFLEKAKRLGMAIYAQVERRQRKEARLSAFIDTARSLANTQDLPELLSTLARQARQLFDVDLAYVTSFDRTPGLVSISAFDGHTSALTTGLTIPDDATMSSGPTPFWTPDYAADERVGHSRAVDRLMRSERIRALMSVPLNDGARPVGTLYVASRSMRYFTAGEVSLMGSLGELAGVAIGKARFLEHAADVITELREHKAGVRGAQEITAVHGRLMDVVLGGGDLRTLAAEAATGLNGAVRIHAPDGAVLATAGEMPAEAEADAVRALVEAHVPREPALLDGGLWAAPVLAGDEDLGTLLLSPRHPLGEHDVRLLVLVTQAIAALLLLRHSHDEAALGHDRDWLLEDLLASPQRPAEQFQERAGRLGIDLSRPHVVVVARPGGEPQDKLAIWASSYARRRGGLKSMHAGCAVLLLPGTDATAAAEQVSRGLAPLLDQPVTVCASGPVEAGRDIAGAYEEALRCLEAMIALGATGGFASAREHGFLGVLLSDTHDVEGFIRSMIGPLADCDARRYTEYTRTLDAYFDARGSITQTAERLHVHPNTVGRRLERVSELLGAGWQQSERAFEIQLALRLSRIQHVLRRRRPVPAGG